MLEKDKSNKHIESLAVLIDLIPDPVLIADSSGQIIAANNMIEKVADYKKEELIGKTISSLGFVTEEYKQLLAKNAKDRLAGANIPPYEIKITNKNGEVKCLKVNGNRFVSNGEALNFATFHDVIEENKIQDELRQDLLASEEKFQGITNAVKEAIITVDQNAVVTYWNPAAENIFGYTNKEAVGKSVHELVVPISMCREGIDRIKTSVKTFGETGMGYFTVGNVELIGRRKNGCEFPAELSMSPVKLCGKLSAVGVVTDITRRKQSEQRLRDAEQRYHALFNQVPLGVLVVDPETAGFVEFNDIAHTQLGYSREEFEKMTVYDIEAVETPEQINAHIKALATEGGSEFETAHRTKNGEIRNTLVTNKSFQSAGKTYLHCAYRDITEIKKVQNALIESEALYRQLVELAQEGIWALDNDFATVFVNPRMAQMLGYKESEMIGKKLSEFVDEEKIRGILQQFKNHEIEGSMEYAFPRKDGTHIYTIITMSTITDDQGQITGMLAVITDITQRKQAEKALKESEELSRAIVANAPIGIATSDSSYHFVSANEAFCRILGYEKNELRKLTFKEITHPEDLSESAQKMHELETGKQSYFILEKRYIRKDGTQIIGRVITNAIRDQTGQPILYIAELEDITKSKRLEDDLRANEERFRAISTSAMDAIILSDEDDRVIYWNPAAEKTFGFTENEAVGKKLAELVIPPHGLTKHRDLLKELLRQPLSKKNFGLLALKKDGSLFPMDLSVISIKLKGKPCLLSIVRDITEAKAMEQALRQERDMLENMATSMDAGLALIGRDYRIIWANNLLKQISGTDLDNKLCYPIFNKSNQICHDCGVKKVFENGATVDRHDYNFKFEGHDDWVELIVTPVKDKDGKVIAALELVVNITERKRLQTKLGEYSQKLEELVQKRTLQLKNTQAELVKSERLAAIGELAGMVGHDLRNPLTGIKNSAYFLKKKGSEISPAQSQEMLETIDKCVNYSNKIVNDLLDYSREVHLEQQGESLKKLLAESLCLLELPEKIEVQDQLSDEPTVNVDADKIKRIFINLIKNAVDAMPNGGKITVASQQVNGRLEVSFSDTGRGISDEVLPKLFSPLFTTKAQGMGFGLTICKRIIEAHGGTITVKTVKEKGTTFTLTFPVEPKISSWR